MLLEGEDVDESSHSKNGEQNGRTCRERKKVSTVALLAETLYIIRLPSCSAFRAMREICTTACLTGNKQRPTDI
jgi:hypothetical protein